MFGIGWSEFLVIAIVAIIVIGPKDLPKVMRSFGKATAKMRTTAAEFRQQFDEAMKEAELDDVKSALDEVRNLDPRRSLTRVFDPFRDAARDVKHSISETNDALRGVATPSLEERAILDPRQSNTKETQSGSKEALPPANYHHHDDNLMMDSSVRLEGENRVLTGGFDDISRGKSKGFKCSKRHASFEMKRPLRQHRLKHNAGRFSHNAYGEKAVRYFERSIKSPSVNDSKNIASNVFKNSNLGGAQGPNE